MHRIDAPGATVSNLFTEGDPGLGIPATQVSDDWLNDVQEEIANAVEDAGIVLAKGTQTQLRDAMQVYAALGGGSLQSKVDDFTASTTEQTLLCDASAASGSKLEITLPTAAVAGAGKSFDIKKTDNSANQVEIIPDGAETIDGTNASVLLTFENDSIKIVSDASNWHVVQANLLEVKTTIVPGQVLGTTFSAMTGNELALTRGVWTIQINGRFGRDSGVADLKDWQSVLSSADGSGSLFSSNGDVDIVGASEIGIVRHFFNSTAALDSIAFNYIAGTFRVNSLTETCYLNALVDRAATGVGDFAGTMIARRENYI